MTLQPKNVKALARFRQYTHECKHIATMRQDDQSHSNLWLSRVKKSPATTITVLNCGKCAKAMDGITIARIPFCLMRPADTKELIKAFLKMGLNVGAFTETGRKLVEEAKTAAAA